MWQPVLMINGYVISVLGLLMAFPILIDLYYKQNTWPSFLISAVILIFIGFSLFLSNRIKIKKITLHQGYLLTVVSWFLITLLATLPFILSGTTANFADAVFESASGITTTGATLLTDLDSLPKSILLWRSMLTVLGGVGVVIFALALLPFLGIGGMQIFHRENSDLNDKILPKFNEIAKRIVVIYGFLVFACAISLKVAGMGWFDALNHSFTTVATGGFSTKDDSIAAFDSASIEMVLSLFMILGSLPMTFYIVVVQQRDLNSLRAEQVGVFLKVLFVYVVIVAGWLYYHFDYDFLTSLRHAIFNVVSMTTTTGYTSVNYIGWGSFICSLFIVMSLTGGCTGSTTGSIKIFRWQVLFAFLRRNLSILTDPNRVLQTKIGNMVIDGKIIISVFMFLSMYFLSIVVLSVLLSFTGLDVLTSFSAVAACITSTGPGIIHSIGPEGNYAFMSDLAKYILSFAMILGRLEIITVLVIFSRNFWR